MAIRTHISTGALLNNCRYLKALCAPSRLIAVVKNNAYGHGLMRVAKTLADEVDGFAVCEVAAALALREAGIERRIVLLQGVQSGDEASLAQRHRLDIVVHSDHQLELLEGGGLSECPALWLKFNTGMNRLGFDAEARDAVLRRVAGLSAREVILMSHLACADEASEQNAEQMRLFAAICKGQAYKASLANSAACLNLPESRLQWVRTGLALYGVAPSSPSPNSPHRERLTPVMRATAPVIALRRVRAGQRIGYGGTYQCRRDTRVAVVAAGYGNGYPIHAEEGTPVYLRGKMYPLVGRISMDMLTIAVDDEDEIRVGDEVECWGENLSVAEVARRSGAIAYDLLCAVGR